MGLLTVLLFHVELSTWNKTQKAEATDRGPWGLRQPLLSHWQNIQNKPSVKCCFYFSSWKKQDLSKKTRLSSPYSCLSAPFHTQQKNKRWNRVDAFFKTMNERDIWMISEMEWKSGAKEISFFWLFFKKLVKREALLDCRSDRLHSGRERQGVGGSTVRKIK